MDDQLRVYKCHKVVRAARIVEVMLRPVSALLLDTGEGSPQFTREVPLEYLSKHSPEAGGYYVVYEDGYRSYSPAQAFESGYSPFVETAAKAAERPAKAAR